MESPEEAEKRIDKETEKERARLKSEIDLVMGDSAELWGTNREKFEVAKSLVLETRLTIWVSQKLIDRISETLNSSDEEEAEDLYLSLEMVPRFAESSRENLGIYKDWLEKQKAFFEHCLSDVKSINAVPTLTPPWFNDPHIAPDGY